MSVLVFILRFSAIILERDECGIHARVSMRLSKYSHLSLPIGDVAHFYLFFSLQSCFVYKQVIFANKSEVKWSLGKQYHDLAF